MYNNSMGSELKTEDLHKLLDYCLKISYRAKDNDTKAEIVLQHCLKLFAKDYQYTVVNNSNGELCSHYPTKIAVLEYQTSEYGKDKTRVESLYDVSTLKELFTKAKFARCRGRFAVPVILFEGKHICRSATISGGVEIYGRSGFDFFFTGGEGIPGSEGPQPAAESNEWQLFNRIRGQDIRLLKTFSVGYICDLMVEKKKVKFGMNVTSSEKVDKENRYSEFSILSAPYPGCEFFKEWRDNGYMAEGLMFDWNQAFVDAQIDLHNGRLSPPHSIDWHKYRMWDLVKLTQNYLHLLLHYVKGADSGLLIHCISGWDRTPLFISLIRLSLWADGVIHTSLGPVDILYLTIAYDWFLFGHNFPDRLAKGEDIFFFCFNFLKYITSDSFDISRHKKPGSRTVSRTDSECNIDGVLLDPEIQRASYKGSNTSINSNSSLNSTKSSVDNAPICFTAGSPEDDFFVPNGNPSAFNANAPRVSPVSKVPPESYRLSSQYTMTSPMAVPTSMRRVSEVKNSPSAGSWQFISGTGSLRGSTSSHESPRSSNSDQSAHLGGHSNNGSQESHDAEETPRKQRLDAARRIFLSVYTSMVEFKNGSEAGGISGLFDHFAEKVGIRSTRGTPI